MRMGWTICFSSDDGATCEMRGSLIHPMLWAGVPWIKVDCWSSQWDGAFVRSISFERKCGSSPCDVGFAAHIGAKNLRYAATYLLNLMRWSRRGARFLPSPPTIPIFHRAQPIKFDWAETSWNQPIFRCYEDLKRMISISIFLENRTKLDWVVVSNSFQVFTLILGEMIQFPQLFGFPFLSCCLKKRFGSYAKFAYLSKFGNNPPKKKLWTNQLGFY